MRLDISTWKTFVLDSLFEVKKGKRLTSEDQTDGNTPYVGAIDSNNGVAKYIGQAPIHEGNTISLSYNGSIGEAFYQPEPYWATDDVNALYLRKKWGTLNPQIALFICTILMQEKYRYCYGRKWTKEIMESTDVLLPATPEGEPDWRWMEDYIKSLHSAPITTNRSNQHPAELHTDDWEPFYLNKLFNAHIGNGVDSYKTDATDPQYNYVSRNSNDNGVVSVVDKIDGEELMPAGSMTLSLGGEYLGATFVQVEPYYTAQNVAVLEPKSDMSLYAKLFIATLIRKESRTLFQAFGRELNKHYKTDFTIRLPVLKDSTGAPVVDADKTFSDNGYIPDWQWMEDYVKSLPYGDRIS